MNPEYKLCPFCDEEIKVNAVKCKHCGEFIDESLHRESIEEKQMVIIHQSPKWSRGVAALLSLIIPGAGQIYKGNVLSGIGWLIFVPLGYMFFIVPGAILHFFCIIAATSGDNSPVPKHTKYEKEEDKEGVHPLVFIVVAAIIIAILYAISDF